MFSRSLSAALFALAAGLFMPGPAVSAETQVAIFAGGCFWCVESDFDYVPGVISTTSGYSGGTLQNPTYQNHEGHREVVKIEFDPARTSFDKLVNVFFRSVDPTDDGGQFCDRGHAYTTAIYVTDKAQKAAAEKAKAEAEAALGRPIVTPIEPARTFWQAEGYHLDYYKKNPLRYKYYRSACGRDARLEELWGEAALQGIASH
ncbi:peptide-methionine (S)-S-oxide reductase MsrA [Allomesorhizobium alhagi]|jgi:peptide-methionine (S)-S-oxide reductase|uniref:Peptide methionine sulfoxide reductase MsrA n=1 Tax=Mesorhizobium alhagi CCNWXJ12-2 TaxID=1107882 RepID=H0HLA6_9HYPH|nr:peptide-methionine (S)-S-oxide reductase MsrA [Mesorhizobium alhagi]EHK58435.1 peptide methionine sulfoxide reductase [Mesorhizobium alhagi CCNWXJ12-2]